MMKLEKFTLKDCNKMGFCSMSIDQDKLLLPIEYLDDYNKLKKTILEGEIPDIEDNSGYLMCMCNDLLKNETFSNFELAKKALINISRYNVNMINQKIYCRLSQYDKQITVNGEIYDEVKTDNSMRDNNIYISAKCQNNRDKIIEWFNSFCFLNHYKMLILINSKGLIDVIKDNRYDSITSRILPYYRDVRVRIHNVLSNESSKLTFHEIPSYIKFNKCDCDFKLFNTDSNKYTEPITYSLNGCPNEIDGNFVVSKMGLKSLTGGPKKVTGNYLVNSNQLKTLNGAPEYVGGCFNLYGNFLTDEEFDKISESPKTYYWSSYNNLNNPGVVRCRTKRVKVNKN